MHADHRPPGQRQRLLEQPLRPLAVAPGQPDLGQPLEAVRLAGGRVGVAVQVDRLLQLALGQVEVAHQQRRLPDQGGGEGDAAQGAEVRTRRRRRPSASSMTSGYGTGP